MTAPAPGSAAGSESAAAIAAAVRSGRRSAGDILASVRLRHAAVHSHVRALVQPRFEAAADEAASVDGPLAGVPVSVKECFPVRGLDTTLGIPARAGRVDEADAAIVAQLRAAGAIVIGKSNVPQAMYLHETDNPVWGRTNHPDAPTRGPGGSSGGDAALVAAGVVPLAVGNDLAGSLRQPAHACGIAAIMPRSAALGSGGACDTLPQLRGMRSRAGFLAREVADLELAVSSLCPMAAPPATVPRRIGWWDSTGPIPPSPAIRRGVAEAVGAVRAAGVAVEQFDPGLAEEAAWLHLAILSADGGGDIRRLMEGSRPIPQVARLLGLAGLPRRWRPFVAAVARGCGRGIEARGLLATGPRSAPEVTELLAARDRLASRFAAQTAGCDAIICPVSALPALRHGTAARLVLAAAPCLLANLLDLAAGAVPVTRVAAAEETARPWSLDPVLRAAAATDRGSAGLPVGVQVIAAPGSSEATVLTTMRLIEAGRLA
ncbi:MAG: Glutamyl-tRNA(Gln) amidotransferase subunit [Planctomycetota bacterium]